MFRSIMTPTWFARVCPALFCALVASAQTADWEKAVFASPKIPTNIAIAISKEAAANAHQAFLNTKASHLDSGCTKCIGKEYSEPCPASWAEKQDGTCQAPAAYIGVCATTQTFLGGSALHKQEAEIACQVCWPCADEAGCDRDWSRSCPYGFTAEPIEFNLYAESTGPTCVADLDYQGGCESSVKFAHVDEKRQFAKRCAVNWPCRAGCEHEPMSTCPIEWTHIGDAICAAPPQYKEDGCNLLQSFQGWTPDMKVAFAQKCRVEWPCKAKDDTIPADGPVKIPKGQEFDLGSCPCRWRPSPDGTCYPTLFAVGPCTQPVRLGTMTAEQKLKWAGDCLLSWPCADDEAAPRALWNIKMPADGPLHEDSGPGI